MNTQPSLADTHPRFSLPAVLLRLEGLAMLGAAVVVYVTHGFGWLPFVLLLLVPDLAALGYLVNARAGNVSYNLAHTLVFPLVLGVVAAVTSFTPGLQVALIWLAHIGMDRAVGYGFKHGALRTRAQRTNRVAAPAAR